MKSINRTLVFLLTTTLLLPVWVFARGRGGGGVGGACMGGGGMGGGARMGGGGMGGGGKARPNFGGGGGGHPNFGGWRSPSKSWWWRRWRRPVRILVAAEEEI